MRKGARDDILEPNRHRNEEYDARTRGRRDREALIPLLGAQFLEHDVRLTPSRSRSPCDGVLADSSRGLFIVAG